MSAALIVGATLASYALGWAIGVPALLPVLNTLASYPFMVAALRRGQLRLAIARMLLWSLTMGLCAALWSYARPWNAGSLFLHAEAYRTEMFTWVMTGRGAESTPSRFIPQQAADAAVFSALALATAGAVAMPMGAILMNQMGHYVGALAAASAHPGFVLALAWHPWAVIRIVSFVTIGVVLSTPLLSRLGRFTVDGSHARRLLALAVAGLVTDIVTKSLFAPRWQALLLHLTGW